MIRFLSVVFCMAVLLFANFSAKPKPARPVDIWSLEDLKKNSDNIVIGVFKGSDVHDGTPLSEFGGPHFVDEKLKFKILFKIKGNLENDISIFNVKPKKGNSLMYDYWLFDTDDPSTSAQRNNTTATTAFMIFSKNGKDETQVPTSGFRDEAQSYIKILLPR